MLITDSTDITLELIHVYNRAILKPYRLNLRYYYWLQTF